MSKTTEINNIDDDVRSNVKLARLAESDMEGERGLIYNRHLPWLQFWCQQLNLHISLYRFSFSSEHHVRLIKGLFSVMFDDPGTELRVQEFVSLSLRKLLKKKPILPNSSLVLPWRPFYDLISKFYFGKIRGPGNTCESQNHKTTIIRLAARSRRFFDFNATEEILDETKPLLCPPGGEPPPFHLWFDEMMDLWKWMENNKDWDQIFLSLFSRLSFNIGHVDWDPYLPWFFSKLLRMMNIPVGSPKLNYRPYNHSFDANNTIFVTSRSNVPAAACLLINMFGTSDNPLKYTEKIFRTLKTFYHPSNYGAAWTGKLGEFLQ
eukprot:UC4_evm1s1403